MIRGQARADRGAAGAGGVRHIFDFSEINPVTHKPSIDWRKVSESSFSAAIFALQVRQGFRRPDRFRAQTMRCKALAQLRDMHGFKAPSKTALTDPSGNTPRRSVEIVRFSDRCSVPRIRLPHSGWQPRPHQLALWSFLENAASAPLRSGTGARERTDVCLHWAAIAAHQRVATYWHMLPEFSQGRKAIWTRSSEHRPNAESNEAFPHNCAPTHEQEMFIRFKCGSTCRSSARTV